LTKLRTAGVGEPALLKARKSITERNVSYLLGTFVLPRKDRLLLGLEPVPGFTARDMNNLLLDEQDEESEAQHQIRVRNQ
jgi:hypothetical protein